MWHFQPRLISSSVVVGIEKTVQIYAVIGAKARSALWHLHSISEFEGERF